MKVYRLEQDADRWQCLVPKGIKYMDVFNVQLDLEEGDSRAATWKPPPMKPIDPDFEECDFSMPDSGALIVHPRAAGVLRPLLEEAGELLPVHYQKETYHFLHVTRYVDGLDWAATKLNSIGEITRYAFDHAKLAKVSLFKIATTTWNDETVMDLELFLAEGHRGPKYDLRAILKAHGFRGLEFKKVWSSK